MAGETWGALLVLVLAPLAGCLGWSADIDLRQDVAPTSFLAPPLPALQYSGCSSWATGYGLPSALVEDELPPGFDVQVVLATTDAVAALVLYGWSCPLSPEPSGAAFAGILVWPSDEYYGNRMDNYLVLLGGIVEDPRLAELFRASGMAISEGTVEVSREDLLVLPQAGTMTRALVAETGGTTLTLESAAAQGAGLPGDNKERWFGVKDREVTGVLDLRSLDGQTFAPPQASAYRVDGPTEPLFGPFELPVEAGASSLATQDGFNLTLTPVPLVEAW